jgi:hypothetical protein
MLTWRGIHYVIEVLWYFQDSSTQPTTRIVEKGNWDLTSQIWRVFWWWRRSIRTQAFNQKGISLSSFCSSSSLALPSASNARTRNVSYETSSRPQRDHDMTCHHRICFSPWGRHIRLKSAGRLICMLLLSSHCLYVAQGKIYERVTLSLIFASCSYDQKQKRTVAVEPTKYYSNEFEREGHSFHQNWEQRNMAF